jgi:hypothetical protein
VSPKTRSCGDAETRGHSVAPTRVTGMPSPKPAAMTASAALTAGGSRTCGGIQFASIAGKIYERARQLGVGRDLPNDMFLQDLPT